MSDVPTTHPQPLELAVAHGQSHPSDHSTRTTERNLRMCLLTLGGESFAVDLRHVREVFEVESVTVVPGIPSLLTGVTNLRGTVVSLIDLRGMLGLGSVASPLPFAVVIRQGARQIGLLVDHVPEIHTVTREDLLPAMQEGPAGARPCVSAVLRVNDRLRGVLEVSQVFALVDGDRTALSAA